MVSMMGILSGASRLMVDVRQTGASPRFFGARLAPWPFHDVPPVRTRE
jgi:hypothetical protein